MLLLNRWPRPGHRFTNSSTQRGLSCHATANQSVNARRRMIPQEIFRRRPQYHHGFPYQFDFTEGGTLLVGLPSDKMVDAFINRRVGCCGFAKRTM